MLPSLRLLGKSGELLLVYQQIHIISRTILSPHACVRIIPLNSSLTTRLQSAFYGRYNETPYLPLSYHSFWRNIREELDPRLHGRTSPLSFTALSTTTRTVPGITLSER